MIYKFLKITMLLCSIFLSAQNQQLKIEETTYSKILQENRNYTVFLPEKYHHKLNKNSKYPVIYVLDGEKKGNITQAVYSFLADNLKPMIFDAIIVAIHQKDRFYELTPDKSAYLYNGKPIPKNKKMGGATTFYEFIKKELDQEIVKNYRTTNYKGIIGHSFGGLFVLHTILKDKDFFNSAIAIDPSLWWNYGNLVNEFKSSKKTFNTHLLVAKAKTNSKSHNKNLKSFINWLETKNYFSNYTVLQSENKNHHTIILPALQEGFNFILGDNSFTGITKKTTVDSIKNYYRKRSNQFNASIVPTNTRIMQYAKICEKLGLKNNAENFYNWTKENK